MILSDLALLILLSGWVLVTVVCFIITLAVIVRAAKVKKEGKDERNV